MRVRMPQEMRWAASQATSDSAPGAGCEAAAAAASCASRISWGPAPGLGARQALDEFEDRSVRQALDLPAHGGKIEGPGAGQGTVEIEQNGIDAVGCHCWCFSGSSSGKRVRDRSTSLYFCTLPLAVIG